MEQQSILYPIAAQLLLILIAAVLTVTRRMAGVKAGDIKASRFKTMDVADLDPKYVTPSNCFNNQFQLPMVFILFILFALQLNIIDDFFIIASWIFVALRYVHAYIHLTYNHVLHRLGAFMAGAVVLYICWGRLLWMVLG